MAGAVLAGVVAALGVRPATHLGGVALIGAVISLALVPSLLHDRPDGVDRGPRFARPSRRLAVFGAIALAVLLSEGAIFDWSGIFLASEQRAGPGLAPMGLAAFSLTMGIGRLLADPAADRFGEEKVARGVP